MTKIALIMPYFGKWPQWIDLFFDSCKSNYDIDFYFFTDCELPEIEATNLYFQQISFFDYCKVISEQLGINFHPSSPIKLCDVKPFYGFIHHNILHEYDFWGFGDVDLVFGNIRKFYTEDLLSKYDVISTHFDRVSGHLALFRNNEKYRNLCFSMRHWKRDLLKEENCILDESEFSYQVFPETRIPRRLYAKIWKYIGFDFAHKLHYWFIPMLSKKCNIEHRRLLFNEMNVHPLWTGSNRWKYTSGDSKRRQKSCLWDEGKNEECIYCHFLPFKKDINWQCGLKQSDMPITIVTITDQGLLNDITTVIE